MKKIIQETIKALKKEAEPDYKKAQEWFFKEGIKLYGVRVGKVRKVAAQMYKEIEPKDKDHIFKLCDELFKHDKQETFITAIVWLEKMKSQWEPKDFATFERWLKKHVSNWAQCDAMSGFIVSPFLREYPKLVPKIRSWRKSTNRWVRRAAAVSLIRQASHGEKLPEIFATAKTLLKDKDDMVQKGYGWMLKAASDKEQKKIFDFVMKHKADMPRTALRYAIEKMPKKLKAQAMAK